MKNKLNKLISFILVLVVLLSTALPVYAGQDTRGNEYFNNILSYKVGNKSVQNWIDTTLSENAGNGTEWYIIALSQSESFTGKHYDYSTFENSLIDYTNRAKYIQPNAKLRISLALSSIGSTNSFISQTMDSAIGQQNIISYIFGLHLFNNGYKSNITTKKEVTNTLLNMQNNDGGWALFGSNSDIDVTAMVIQSLSTQQNNNNVKSAIDNALNYLSLKQTDDGSFEANNNGKIEPTSESTAQVLLALCSLNIDCNSDDRFIKNSNTIFDGLEKFRSGNAFCHLKGGSINDLATQQVFYTMVSYNRMNSLFILDKARANEVQKVQDSAIAQNNNSVNQAVNNHNNDNDCNSTPINSESHNSTNIKNNVTDNSTSNIDETTDAYEQISKTDNHLLNENELTSNTQITNVDSINNDIIQSTTKKASYKLWVIIAILILYVIICIVLHFTKKGNKGNYIIISVVSCIAIIILLLTNIESVNTHKNSIIEKENSIGTVTISITCNTIKNNTDNEFIPNNGIILDTTSIDILENETVYDILNEVCIKNDIALETSGTTQSIYVKGINHIYEFDYGDLSGWMYHVNGQEPSLSCDSYTLSNGDIIEWKYTCNIGQDIK